MASKTYHLYILSCADGTLYTGITTDLERRLAEHNGAGGSSRSGCEVSGPRGGADRGAKYTRSRRPVSLVYSRRFRDRSGAQRAEAALKKLSRAQKLALIGSGARPRAHSR